jgi:energy-coupling factor transporter ATP-binding protein EcfA2
MWLQTMWFLSRVHQAGTVILDEPDVYMHADLQRKLIRYVRRGHQQVIVTTHSTEIMSEVNPEDIVVIDKAQRESRRADSLPAVQRVLTTLGSSQNVHLARLWNARRFLLVEGDDVPLLHAFQTVLNPGSSFPIAAIPNSSFGGWGGWRYALGECRALKNASGAQIIAYCFLDSDYHTPSQIEEVRVAFSTQGGQLHVWRMKEIENYLMIAAPIVRAIKSRLPRRASEPTVHEVTEKLAEFAEELRDNLLDGFAQEHLSSNRALGAGGANRAARLTIEEREGRLGLPGVVSGKLVLHRLLGWIQSEFGVSLNALAIISHFTKADIDTELVSVLTAIEDLSPFPK